MSTHLSSFGDDLRVVIIGSSGGIGGALTSALSSSDKVKEIYALSRRGITPKLPKTKALTLDILDEDDIKAAAETVREGGKVDLLICATGLLQGDGISPEKSMRMMEHDALAKSFAVNAIGPAMVAKHFLPLLPRDKRAGFFALSARVGSISDNRLGGWYGYRASKAALNMILKTLSIEYGRRYNQAIIAGLHPGTVDTDLSKPFQGNVPNGKLFTPDFSAEKLLEVINGLTPDDSGNLFAWDGKRIEF